MSIYFQSTALLCQETSNFENKIRISVIFGPIIFASHKIIGCRIIDTRKNQFHSLFFGKMLLMLSNMNMTMMVIAIAIVIVIILPNTSSFE
jgi:hypothetical protein